MNSLVKLIYSLLKVFKRVLLVKRLKYKKNISTLYDKLQNFLAFYPSYLIVGFGMDQTVALSITPKTSCVHIFGQSEIIGIHMYSNVVVIGDEGRGCGMLSTSRARTHTLIFPILILNCPLF